MVLLASSCSSSASTAGKDSGEGLGEDAPLATPDVHQDTSSNKDAVKAPDLPDAAAYLSDPSGKGISRLHIEGRNLYWISGYHRLMKASLDDQKISTLYTTPGTDSSTIALADFATDSENAYLAYDGDKDYANRGVHKLPLDGSAAPIVLARSPNPNVTYPNSVVVSGDSVCYSEASAIRQVKTSGGDITTMVQNRGTPNDQRLLIQDAYVYFTMAFGATARDELYRWPIGAPAPAPVDGGGAGGVDGGVDGGGSSVTPEKVSLVPGNYSILLGRRVDRGYLYWAVENVVYRTDGKSPAVEVLTGGSPLQPSDTGVGYCLFPFEGVLYWGHGTFSGSDRLFKQTVGVAGNGTVIANFGPNDMVADADYLYVADGADIWRLPR